MENKGKTILLFVGIVLLNHIHDIHAVSWEDWWTYDGISGPSFWGLINPEWSLCNAGRKQSPVNIKPEKLLYDPTLEKIYIGQDKTKGNVVNTGHGISFLPELDINDMVNISGGPLSYNYPIYDISLHFGLRDEIGSEHSIDGSQYAGELQFLGYNADLYDNYTSASWHPNGLVGLSVLVQIGQMSNIELRKITDAAASVPYRGDVKKIENVTIPNLLPTTQDYMTYEGSQTQPGCSETVTWIILNKPIYITHKQLYTLRKLNQGDVADPRAPLGANFRPIQPLNGRTIRTNIFLSPTSDPNSINQGMGKCPTLQDNVSYKASKLKIN